MAKYEYVCDKCSVEYVEHRPSDDAQYFTVCHTCHDGNYILK